MVAEIYGDQVRPLADVETTGMITPGPRSLCQRMSPRIAELPLM
jgi:hypothetical protein